MQIKLDHIGIIKDSTLSLNGLTVITGKNSSGKTTVGKALYALLDATQNLKTRAQSDRNSYIKKKLISVAEILTGGLRYILTEQIDTAFSGYPALCALLTGDIEHNADQNLDDFRRKLEQELKDVDSTLLKPLLPGRTMRRYDRKTQSFYLTEITPRKTDDLRQEALAVLEQLSDDLKKDTELCDYTRESINQAFRVEFNGQIQPIHMPDASSTVELSEPGEDAPVYFHFSIANNTIVNDGDPVFFGVPFKRVYMIDDPFILDTSPEGLRSRGFYQRDLESIFNPARIHPHNYRLRQELTRAKPINVFEQTILNNSLKSIEAQISQVIPGTFEFSSEGDYYVENGTKVKFSNLATGSKMFSIIKLLMDHGRLDGTTMLILDEPEAHLHPEWQNIFAEIIVLLVKELKVKVLLTTHSPNFMLALDAYMRKHNIIELTSFYQTETLVGGFVQYHCVNQDLGKIYDDFLQYLSEMKMLRDQYLYGGEASM